MPDFHKKWRAGFFLLPFAAVALSYLSRSQAMAQVYVPDDVLTVHQDRISDAAPLGVRAGSFIVDPGIELQTVYDDNFSRTQHHQLADLLADVKPALGIQSDWQRHSLFFGAEGDFGRFRQHTDLNFNDYGLLASGQYDLAYQTYFTGAISQAHRHEDLGTLEDTGNNQPVSYTATAEQLGFTRALGPLSLRLLGVNEHVSVGAQEESDGITFLNQSEGLSRDDHRGSARIGYETSPGNDFFIRGLYDNTNYEPLTGGSLTSNGGDVRAGVDFGQISFVTGSLFGGYLARSYQDHSSKTSDPYGGGQLNFNLSPITLITADVDKQFVESTVAGGAGIVQTSHRLKLLHSFTTKFSANATLGFDKDDRVGDPTFNSKANVYYGGLGGIYQFTDQFGISGDYSHRNRDSDRADDSYKDNRIVFSLIYIK